MPRKNIQERNIIDFRKTGWKDIIVLGKYNYKRAHKQLPPHSHRQMLEICFCSKGGQIYEVKENLYRLKGGDVFVTYPGEVHSTGDYPEEKGELYWMIIRIPPLDRKASFLQYTDKPAFEWYNQLLNLPRHFRGNSNIRLKLEDIFNIYYGKKDGMRLIRLQHSIATFLLEIIQAAQIPVQIKQTGRMEKLDLFIKERIDEPVMLQEMAAMVDLSLSRFKAWFKEETGTTPLDYVLRYKLNIACNLLENGERTIADIAFETGFQNQQYFATVFRKFMGMSPGEYRRNIIRRK